MNRVQIELLCPDETRVYPLQARVMLQSCFSTLERLGHLGEMVETFKVSFVSFDEAGGYGPSITVYFKDPLGATCFYGTDYRFMGTGGKTPSVREIVEVLMENLPRSMAAHIENGKRRLAQVRQEFRRLASRP